MMPKFSSPRSQVPSEEAECHALLGDQATPPAAERFGIAGYPTDDGWEASDSVCGCTLHALRSLVLAPAEASGDGESEDGQQGLARSAAHAMMRLLSARCSTTLLPGAHGCSSADRDPNPNMRHLALAVKLRPKGMQSRGVCPCIKRSIQLVGLC